MGNNPLVLGMRFLLEVAALVATGYWGWTQHEGIAQVLLAIGVPLVVAALWGTFRVDGMPNKAPVAVPGPVRLLLEFAVFGLAVVLLTAAGAQSAALVLGGLVVFHYLLSYDYVLTLLRLHKTESP